MISSTTTQADVVVDTSGFWGHPKALTTLFIVEMFERFSFYGMKAILLYYMIAPHSLGGLEYSTQKSGIIFGIYCMAVYLMAIPGGIIADRFQGAMRTLFMGLVVIMLGHIILMLMMFAMDSELLFFSGLICVVLGTGLLKPNVSTALGLTYGGKDKLREAGFFIFYMGINIGAATAPIMVGYLAQDAGFRNWLTDHGFDANSSWHWGFGVTAIGVLFALGQLLLHWGRFKNIGGKPVRTIAADKKEKQPLTRQEKRNLLVIGILFFVTVLFWTIYEQSGSSLALFTATHTRNVIFGWEFPASWYASLQAAFVIVLSPVFGKLWQKLGDREPSGPAKFSFGLAAVGFGIAIMVLASYFAGFGPISKNWLIAVYFFEVVGEMCLSPVGLSLVSKLAPARLGSTVMGVWFLAAAIAGLLAGLLGTYFDVANTNNLMIFFGSLALAAFVAAFCLYKSTPKVNKLIG